MELNADNGTSISFYTDTNAGMEFPYRYQYQKNTQIMLPIPDVLLIPSFYYSDTNNWILKQTDTDTESLYETNGRGYQYKNVSGIC